MSVEEKIIEFSNEKIKALAPRAKKAMENPENGIKIMVAGAKFVIRDCAMITDKFLPVMLYKKMESPLKTLKGKITKKEFDELISSNSVLADIMVIDALKVATLESTNNTLETTPEPDDIYGDYGSDVSYEEEKDFDWDDDGHKFEILCKAFKVK